MPDGLVVLGDALCSFNPIYGQGMTTAALAADTLGEVLAAEPAPLASAAARGASSRIQQALARVIDMPWLLTTTEDLRSPEAAGERPLWVPLVNWYTARVHARSRVDPDVFRRFLEVMHLIEPPSALFRPAAVWRILTGGTPWASG
jgi:2-polyprenyl-6-methoxyphenol hydroxylase-like FAD-dependent oxidoreductase